MQSKKAIGLIAGNGFFPIEFAKTAKEKGYEVIVLAHLNETNADIKKYATFCKWVYVGQIEKIIETLKSKGVKETVFLGGIKRPSWFGLMRLDKTARKIIANLKNKKDDAVLRGIAQEIESQGIKVIAPEEILDSSIVKEGLLTKRDFTEKEKNNLKLAWEAALKLGEVDAGQTVLAYDELVIAIEAQEGTDATIERAGELTKIKSNVKQDGLAMVKLCKVNQDKRLDLPAIGPNTIQNMKKAGVTALALKTDSALMLMPEITISEANSFGIALKVVNEL